MNLLSEKYSVFNVWKLVPSHSIDGDCTGITAIYYQTWTNLINGDLPRQNRTGRETSADGATIRIAAAATLHRPRQDRSNLGSTG